MSNTDKQQVERIIVDCPRAVAAGDRRAIIENRSDDTLMLDFLNVVEGVAADMQ